MNAYMKEMYNFYKYKTFINLSIHSNQRFKEKVEIDIKGKLNVLIIFSNVIYKNKLKL